MNDDFIGPRLKIYSDGSGDAEEQLAQQLKQLTERERVVQLLRAFIARHGATLAGLRWTVSFLGEGEIEISHHNYRGQWATPELVAGLWPGAGWEYAKPRFSFKENECRDLVATVDGVVLRIEEVVKVKLVPEMQLPRAGSRLRKGAA